MKPESGNEQDARVEKLWKTLDVERKGQVDVAGLRRGLKKMDHPLQDAEEMLRDVMDAVDSNKDGRIEYHEFHTFVQQAEMELWRLFKSIDHDDNGKLDRKELEEAFLKAGLKVSKAKLSHLFDEVDTNRDGVISFDEWRDFLLFMPAAETSLHEVLSYYQNSVKVNPEGDVLISDDTIQGLGTFANFLVHALFGSIIAVAHPHQRSSLSTSPPFTPESLSPTSLLPSIGYYIDYFPFNSDDIEPDEFFSHPPQTSMPKGISPQARPPITGAAAAVAVSDLRSLPGAGAGGNVDNAAVTAVEGSYWGSTFWHQELKPVLIACVPNPGYFIAGGVAGIVSRTATAPLDRLKVYLIAQTSVAEETVQAAKSGAPMRAVKGASIHLVNATKDLWRAGGIRSLYAGNGLNIVKVMPESAIKFGSYEAAKRVLAKLEGVSDTRDLHSWSRFAAGGVSGIVSQFFVYPVDTLKFRMQCETVEGGLHGNRLIVQTTKKMWATDGVRGFFRGLPMGLVGMFPYAAIDLGTFEYLKRAISVRKAKKLKTNIDDPAALPSSFATATMGAFSGALGASLVYPLNLLRTRLQSQGTVQHPRRYTGIMDVTRQTIQGEGVRGLFKGITPNLLKVVPAVSITYVVYEKSKQVLNIH